MLGEIEPEKLLLPRGSRSRESASGTSKQRLLQRLRRRAISKSAVCPLVRSRWAAWPAPGASSSAASSFAPHARKRLIAPNLDERLQDAPVGQPEIATRAQKSRPAIGKSPSAWRPRYRIDRPPSPTFLDRQQAEPDGVVFDREFNDERWTSGGRTSIPRRRPSATAAETFSSLSRKGRQHRRHGSRRCSSPSDMPSGIAIQTVAGGRPCESVPLEGLECGEDGVDDLRLDTSLGGLGHDLWRSRSSAPLLLADGVSRVSASGPVKPASALEAT